MPPADRLGVGERPGQALGEQAAAARRLRPVDGGEQAASTLASQRAGQFEIGAGRRVDQHGRAHALADRRRQRRAGAELGALDIGERGGGSRDLGAAEGAEGVERGDAEEFLEAALARGGIKPLAGQRRHGRGDIAPEFPELGIVMDRVGADDLARLQACELDGKAALVGFEHGEAAGRDVHGRDAVGIDFVREPAPGDGDQQARPAGVEQALLGDRARGDQANDIALHHRFGAALLGLGRVLGLLANGDAVAGGDQLLQIVVGAFDRDAAHGDVLAEMLAALGQHDAERARGDLGVLEEQFVEIAHPVEQKAVRIIGLDLDVLRHHRRDAAGIGRRGGLGFRDI